MRAQGFIWIGQLDHDPVAKPEILVPDIEDEKRERNEISEICDGWIVGACWLGRLDAASTTILFATC